CAKDNGSYWYFDVW
nr:immunoglobulin heavy chain junction region [Mus musculus]